MDLNLDAVKNTDEQQDIEQNMPDIFKNVELVMILPNGKELRWNYAIGESIQTLKKRLVDDEHYLETSKFYLEEKSDKTYMLDPLSLNDFPRIQELAKNNAPVKIIVEGTRVADKWIGNKIHLDFFFNTNKRMENWLIQRKVYYYASDNVI